MLGMIGASIEITIMFIALSLCRRYVFLEKNLEGKKQQYFNIGAVVLLILCDLLLGEVFAQLCLFLIVGTNISLARTTHRFAGFFLVIPIAGIVNGIIMPVFLVVSMAIGLVVDDIRYILLVYGGILAFLLLFYVKGKNWRHRFESQMGDRKLQKWETLLLCIVGCLMMAFSSMLGYSMTLLQQQSEIQAEKTEEESINLEVEEAEKTDQESQNLNAADLEELDQDTLISDVAGQFVSNLVLTGMVSFILSITIIILIMQGNKRAYYYEKTQHLSLQMVQALANTIDAKDSYTNGHSTRVAKYSVMIAKRMGYQGADIKRIQYTALLHDIGKIGIPVEIINKPSRLTDEEYEIIKTHPVIGSRILSEITELPDISIGARFHHERYDGRGYPDHKKETEIPEIARIIGVADAYDAMTSKRSYRDVLPQSVVRGEIEKGRGSQFDPGIAEVMLEIIDEDKNYEMHE